MQRSHRIGGSERAPTTGASFRFSESMRLPQHEHLSFRALRAHQPPPPGYSAVSLAQILRADRAAWNMIAEKISTLKRNAQGDLPLELEIQRVLAHPSVSFHLLPLPSKPAPSAPVRPGNKRERERAHGHERFRELHQLQLHPKAKKGSKNRIQLQTSPQNSSERHCKPLEGIDCAGLTVWERSVLMQSQVRSVHEAFTYAPNQIVRSHTACRSRSDKHLRASRCCPLQKQLFETKVVSWIRGVRLKNFTV